MGDQTVFAVVGPGAVGGLFAWLLHRAGHDVVAVGAPGDRRGDPPATASRCAAASSATACSGSAAADRGAARRERHRWRPRSTGWRTCCPGSRPRGRSRWSRSSTASSTWTPLRRALPGVPVAGASVTVSALRVSPTVIDHRSPFVRIEVPEAAAGFASVARADRRGTRACAVGGTEAEVLWAKFRLLASLALLTSYWRQPAGAAPRARTRS